MSIGTYVVGRQRETRGSPLVRHLRAS
jgi:hypothetical protein